MLRTRMKSGTMITGSDTRKVEKISEEDGLTAGKAQPRQRVAGHGVEQERNDRHCRRDEERVEQVAQEGHLGQHVDEVVPASALGDQVRLEHFGRRLEADRAPSRAAERSSSAPERARPAIQNSADDVRAATAVSISGGVTHNRSAPRASAGTARRVSSQQHDDEDARPSPRHSRRR